MGMSLLGSRRVGPRWVFVITIAKASTVCRTTTKCKPTVMWGIFKGCFSVMFFKICGFIFGENHDVIENIKLANFTFPREHFPLYSMLYIQSM